MSRGVGLVFCDSSGGSGSVRRRSPFTLYTQDGLYHFEPPVTFATCKAGTLGDAENCRLTDTEKIVGKLHVNWGHASAQHLKRVSVDSARNNMHPITCVDEVPAQRDVCQAFGKAQHVPAAGTSTVAMFNGKLQADLPSFGDIVALHIMDAPPKNSLLIPVRTKNPQEFGDARCNTWTRIFGPPTSIQMDDGREWKNASRAELRP